MDPIKEFDAQPWPLTEKETDHLMELADVANYFSRPDVSDFEDEVKNDEIFTNDEIPSSLNQARNEIWKCKTCQKSFSARKNMLRHERLHSANAKHIKCSHCGKGFARRYAAKHHETKCLKRPSTSEADSFSARKNMLRHERLHSENAKHIKCSHCGKGFARRYAAKHHETKCLKRPSTSEADTNPHIEASLPPAKKLKKNFPDCEEALNSFKQYIILPEDGSHEDLTVFL
ncbi:Zinc finger protein 614, partial [Stegodyphus mimosarum]